MLDRARTLLMPSAGTTAVSPLLTAFASFVPFLLAFILPRSTVVMIFLLALFAMLANLMRGTSVRAWLRLSPWLVAVYVLAGYVLITALWSVVPEESVGKAALLALFGTAAAFSARTVANLDLPVDSRWSALGMLVAVVIGALAVGFEAVTGQWLARMLIETFPTLAGDDARHVVMDGETVRMVSVNAINRRATVLALLFWPALMAMAVLAPVRWRLALVGGLAALFVLVIMASYHQSSQAGVVVGGLAFAAMLVAPNWTLRLLAVVWCLSFLVVVPLAQVPHAAGWHKAPWLFESARQRVIIWNSVATQARKQPLFGIGANAMPKQAPHDGSAWVDSTPLATVDPQRHRHPHNAFLQAWYELGLVGVVLFAALGLAALTVAARGGGAAGDPVTAAMCVAMLATAATISAFSYSIWQPWYQAIILMAVAAAARAIGAGRPSVPAAATG